MSQVKILIIVRYKKMPLLKAHFDILVRTMRFELTRAYTHYPLKVACLPFHHVRRYLYILLIFIK